MERSLATYRTKSFISERDISSISYEVKRTRAVWDDALSIPGTNRRGGWRCPPGTRYGGQITDRFGRNCGWGASRRLANEISDLGERLENIGERRQRRREQRAMRRQGRGAGVIERAAGRVARALETNETITPEVQQRPRRQRQGAGRRRPNFRDSEQRRIQREIEQPGAPRTGEARRRATRDTVNRPRPAAPTAQPAKKVPAKKAAPKKKAPAKKRVAKKQPAKKVAAKKAATPKAKPEPKLSAQNKPSVSTPQDELDFDAIRQINWQQNDDAFANLMVQLRRGYKNEPWLNGENIRTRINGQLSLHENYLDNLNDRSPDEIRDAIARNNEGFQQVIDNNLERINELELRLVNEPDADIRKQIAQNMMERGEVIHTTRKKMAANENYLNALNKRVGNQGENNIELPLSKPEKASDIVGKEALDDARKRVSVAIDKNKKILGDYLDKRYGKGNSPWKEMTPERIKQLVKDADSGDEDAKRAIINWATQMYSHDLIKGANGKNYRIEVTASYFRGNISISGVVRRQKRDGTWSLPIGETGRTITISGDNQDNWNISNNLLKLKFEQDKGAGIATVYNHHAFMYGKAAGIKKATVGSAWDGPYVWGRFGYRAESPISVSRIQSELNSFEQGRSGLIKNEQEAARIRALLAEHKKLQDANVPNNDKRYPRHADYILALDVPGQPKEARASRQSQLRDWFIVNMPMNRGVFFFDENNVSDDPRN